MPRQKQIQRKDFSQLLKQAGINHFHYNANSRQYQFLLYLDMKFQAGIPCRGILQQLPPGYQLRIQSDSWHGRIAEPEELRRQNDALRQTLRYPPQFCQDNDGVWLQSSLAPGTRLEYRFSTSLLQMLRIIRVQDLSLR